MSLYERPTPEFHQTRQPPLGYQIVVQPDPTCEDWYLWVVLVGDSIEAEGEDDNAEACYNAALKAANRLSRKNRRSFNPYHPDHGIG